MLQFSCIRIFLLRERATTVKDISFTHCLLKKHFLVTLNDRKMEAHFSSNELIDPRLAGNFTAEGMKELVGLAFQCLNPSSRRRPRMRLVATELDRILETEMSMTTFMGDGTTIVTLGSQLFSSWSDVGIDFMSAIWWHDDCVWEPNNSYCFCHAVQALHCYEMPCMVIFKLVMVDR